LLCTLRDGTALAVLHAANLLASLRGAQDVGCEAVVAAPKGLREWALVGAVGLTGPFIGPLATLLCVAWASADVAGILNALTPAVTAVLAVALRLERATVLLALGLLLGTAAGVLAVRATGAQSDHPAQNYALGVVAGAVMATAQAIFLIAAKPLLQPTNKRPAMGAALVTRSAYAVAFAASSASLLLLALARGWAEALRGLADTSELWLALYSGVVCAALNYTLITWANKFLPATVCALYGVMQPPLTAIIAFCVKGEQLTVWGYVSMALAIASLVVVSFDRSRSAASAAALDAPPGLPGRPHGARIANGGVGREPLM